MRNPREEDSGYSRWQDPVLLWWFFIAVHAFIILGTLVTQGQSYGDVFLYHDWIRSGFEDGLWPTLTSDSYYSEWVYPFLAIIPMIIAYALSFIVGVGASWLIVTVAASAVAFWFLIRTPRLRIGGWVWLTLLLALGPISLVRLDIFVSVAVVIALALATRHPAIASLILAAGAWIKVVPGLVLWPFFAMVEKRWRLVVAPALGLSIALVGFIWLAGGEWRSLSFLSQQGQRGLQIESVGAGFVMLSSLWGADVSAKYNDEIYTWEVVGQGVSAMAHILPILLVAVVVIVCAVNWFKRRDGLPVLAWAALAMLSAAIVFNKVGSAQFQAWLIAPLAFGLALWPRHIWWKVSGVLGVIALFLTQIIYPYRYTPLLELEPLAVVIINCRNLAVIGLLIIALFQLVTIRSQNRSQAGIAGTVAT